MSLRAAGWQNPSLTSLSCCRCLITKNGSYTMEDWLHLTETFSRLVVPLEMLPENFRKMWLLLQRAACHYFRASPAPGARYPFTPPTVSPSVR